MRTKLGSRSIHTKFLTIRTFAWIIDRLRAILGTAAILFRVWIYLCECGYTGYIIYKCPWINNLFVYSKTFSDFQWDNFFELCDFLSSPLEISPTLVQLHSYCLYSSCKISCYGHSNESSIFSGSTLGTAAILSRVRMQKKPWIYNYYSQLYFYGGPLFQSCSLTPPECCCRVDRRIPSDKSSTFIQLFLINPLFDHTTLPLPVRVSLLSSCPHVTVIFPQQSFEKHAFAVKKSWVNETTIIFEISELNPGWTRFDSFALIHTYIDGPSWSLSIPSHHCLPWEERNLDCRLNRRKVGSQGGSQFDRIPMIVSGRTTFFWGTCIRTRAIRIRSRSCPTRSQLLFPSSTSDWRERNPPGSVPSFSPFPLPRRQSTSSVVSRGRRETRSSPSPPSSPVPITLPRRRKSSKLLGRKHAPSTVHPAARTT